MTRALVTQMLEALGESRGDVSQCLQDELPKAGYERYDRRIKAIAEQLEKHDAAIKAAREYLATEPSGELAQSAEPYGWMVSGTPTVMRGSMAQAIQEQEAKRIGGTCKAFPVYTAPQQAKRVPLDESEDLYALALKADNWGQP